MSEPKELARIIVERCRAERSTLRNGILVEPRWVFDLLKDIEEAVAEILLFLESSQTPTATRIILIPGIPQTNQKEETDG